MDQIIPRAAETEVLRLIHQFPAVAIVGPRQVGKTTLVKSIAARLAKPMRYLDLEYPADLAALAQPAAFLERYTEETIILDEVQRLPGLFPILRSLIDRRREPGRFLLLGSASPELIQQSSESLAGRIAFLELMPFALSEVKPPFPMETHWLRGGFPNALLVADEQASLDWRRNFIQTYLERDFRLLGLQADPTLLARLWTMLAHLNGNLLNKETLVRSLGIQSATLTKYLHLFEAAFQIHTLFPFIPNVPKRLVKSPKIYFCDTGLLHYLLNIRDWQGLLGHPALGASWEAYVINQVAFHLPDGWEMFFYRTHDGSEVDLVLASGGVARVAVEIKFNQMPTVSRGFITVQQDLKTERAFVICPIQTAFPLKNGAEAIGLGDLGRLFV